MTYDLHLIFGLGQLAALKSTRCNFCDTVFVIADQEKENSNIGAMLNMIIQVVLILVVRTSNKWEVK